MGFSTTLTSRCCRPCFSETMALTTRCCDSKFCQHVAGVGGVVVYLCTTLCIATLYGPILCCYDVFTCLMMLQWWEEQWALLCREAVRKIGAVFSDDGGVDPYVVPRPKSANVVEITWNYICSSYFATLDTHWLTCSMDCRRLIFLLSGCARTRAKCYISMVGSSLGPGRPTMRITNCHFVSRT